MKILNKEVKRIIRKKIKQLNIINIKNIFNYLIILLALVLLQACSRSSDRAEIERFIKDTKMSELKKVEPLPEIKRTINKKFTGRNKRSPFVTSKDYIRDQVANQDTVEAPDLKRTKEVLEGFKLEELKMVGTLKKNKKSTWALIMDNNGRVYKVQEGSYIGDNFGKIEKIDEKTIEINQIVTNGLGGWQQNKVIMMLTE